MHLGRMARRDYDYDDDGYFEYCNGLVSARGTVVIRMFGELSGIFFDDRKGIRRKSSWLSEKRNDGEQYGSTIIKETSVYDSILSRIMSRFRRRE